MQASVGEGAEEPTGPGSDLFKGFKVNGGAQCTWEFPSHTNSWVGGWVGECSCSSGTVSSGARMAHCKKSACKVVYAFCPSRQPASRQGACWRSMSSTHAAGDSSRWQMLKTQSIGATSITDSSHDLPYKALWCWGCLLCELGSCVFQ